MTPDDVDELRQVVIDLHRQASKLAGYELHGLAERVREVADLAAVVARVMSA